MNTIRNVENISTILFTLWFCPYLTEHCKYLKGCYAGTAGMGKSYVLPLKY